MKPIRSAFVLAVILLGLEPGSNAQTGALGPKAPTAVKPATPTAVDTQPANQPDSSSELVETPVVKLDFEAQPAIPGVPESHVFVGPILCSPDGIPFVAFPQPPDYMSQVVYSLDPKGGHSFSANGIPGLYDAHFHSYFISNSVVGLLVNATKDGKKASYTVTILPGAPPRDVYPGVHHSYLVEFDRDGSYKKTIDLPTDYHFWRIAALPDDTLLALAYDRVNSVPWLYLLDSSGQIIRNIELPEKMLQSPDLTQGETGSIGKQVAAESSMSWWLFANARQRVLLYQAHSKSPVLEVGAGGVVREVPLQAPKGYVLDGVISANDRWIVRYRKESLSNSGQIDTHAAAKNFAIYEVDPSDGSLRTQIDPGTMPFPDIACEQDGVFTAFSVEGGKVIRKTADLPR